MIRRYRKLTSDVGDKYDVYWVFQSDNGVDDKMLLSEGVNVYYFNHKSLNDLYYIPLSEKLYGNEHFIMERFVHDNQKYRYYWIVEYDVVYKGDWSCFFSSFDKCDADFLSSHVEFKIDAEQWPWWHLIKLSPEYNISKNNYVKSFNPIYRISKRAAEYLDSFLKKDNYGFYEIIMATALYHAGFCVQDIGGSGYFVPDGRHDAHYIDGEGVNSGTMRFRPVFSKDDILKYPLNNKLFHPLK